MKIRVTYSESELDKKLQHEAAVKRLFPGLQKCVKLHQKTGLCIRF